MLMDSFDADGFVCRQFSRLLFDVAVLMMIMLGGLGRAGLELLFMESDNDGRCC